MWPRVKYQCIRHHEYLSVYNASPKSDRNGFGTYSKQTSWKSFRHSITPLFVHYYFYTIPSVFIPYSEGSRNRFSEKFTIFSYDLLDGSNFIYTSWINSFELVLPRYTIQMFQKWFFREGNISKFLGKIIFNVYIYCT